MKTLMKVAQGEFQLLRLPYQKEDVLQAWNAADEYVLDYIAEHSLLNPNSSVLVINDSFGALSVALSEYKIISISDSLLSQEATRINMKANKKKEIDGYLRSSLDWPEELQDLVIIKIPKTLALLEDQLSRLQVLLKPTTIVIGAGMVKSMSNNVWKLMAKYIGETKPSLAKKKARLIFAKVAKNEILLENPYPSYFKLENTDYMIQNHANVFSRVILDIGTRFLLEYLAQDVRTENLDKPVTPLESIIDLGCGSGIVGLMLAKYYEQAEITFVDESYMAVASAKHNYNKVWNDRSANFLVANGLIEYASDSTDLIVCNPPFHQQHTIGNQVALSLFEHSYRVLKKTGRMIVIGNLHLGYHLALNKLFGNCKEVAKNEKFIVWEAIK